MLVPEPADGDAWISICHICGASPDSIHQKWLMFCPKHPLHNMNVCAELGRSQIRHPDQASGEKDEPRCRYEEKEDKPAK